MLKIKNTSKKFGNFLALDGVNFELKTNGVYGLLGPNGAGKTTLMRTVVGFLTATDGEIWWNGKLIDTKSMEHKQKVGYLPENNPLYVNMTVSEYLSFIAELKEEDTESLVKIAKDCGLTKVMGNKIETLSKGYKQRIGLAAALIGNPKLLILDEPTSGLDPNQIIEIRKLIKGLAKNKIVLLSTHILPEAKEICSRILIINRGKIVLDDETKKIKNLEKKFIALTL